MKTYNYETASKLAVVENIIPTKTKLWESTNRLFQLQELDFLIKYYEKHGGTWRITKTTVAESLNIETVVYEDNTPVCGMNDDEEAIEWLKWTKNHRPDLYEKLKNWE
jgi:hypothetical protein